MSCVERRRKRSTTRFGSVTMQGGVWMSSKLVLPFEISPSWKFLDVVENLQRWEKTCPGLLEKVIMVC